MELVKQQSVFRLKAQISDSKEELSTELFKYQKHIIISNDMLDFVSLSEIGSDNSFDGFNK